MFKIFVTDLGWLEKCVPKEDKCLHGNATAIIGEETFGFNAVVSSTGLYLLKSLTQDHVMNRGASGFLPCCGHFIYQHNDKDSVETMDCPNGIDWSVIHEDGKVKLVTESGAETVISIEEYTKIVHDFCDIIEDYYINSEPKVFDKSEKEEEKNYKLFWKEWHRRRGRK